MNIIATFFALITAASSQDVTQPPSALADSLNRSGNLSMLTGNHIIRYSSHTVHSPQQQQLTLTSRRLKYAAENAAMFAQKDIPDLVPHLQAQINLCDIKAITTLLPGPSLLSKAGSDAVLPITFSGEFSHYLTLTDKSREAYTGDVSQFEYYIRSSDLFNVSDSLQTAQIEQCTSKALELTIKSIYHSGNLSREQAEKLINSGK